MFIGSFSPDDYDSFQTDVEAAVGAFKKAKVTNVLIDLSNNGGQSFNIKQGLNH